MEQAPRTGVPGPSAHGPRGPVDTTAPPEEVPEVADARGARALGLRRIAEELHDTVGGALAGALRAHAGDVDALAEHLRDAGGDTAARDAPPSAP